MTDTELIELIENLSADDKGYFAIAYKRPSHIGGGHTLEIESPKCLGSITFWAAGSIDWHIFDIQTATECFLGECEAINVREIEVSLRALFEAIKYRDCEL